MKRVCSFGLTAVVAFGLLACLNVSPAHARKEYKDQFVKKYVTDSPSTPAQKAMATIVEDYNCGICHIGPGGSKKKERNAYGTALSEVLEKKEKDAGKIDAGLDKVASKSSEEGKAGAPTFGDLLKEGKLPAPAEKKAPAAE